jgi:hypothetical protein
MPMAKRRARAKSDRSGGQGAAQAQAPKAPVATEPLDLNREWPHAAGVFATVLALYAATAAHTVCLEDDGLFTLASRTMGLPQPPGYPLLILLGKLITLLPLGPLAYRGHLVSAVFGAATCGVLWLVLQVLLRDRLASWAGALLLGVSSTFWSQAIICKTYTLNTFLFFTALYLILDFRATRRPRTLYLLSACYGLSLANHWPLMGLSTLCLALALAPRWRDVLPRLHKAASLALLCAAVPYAWMIWRSHQHPEISFYGPISSLDDFWFFLTRKGFGWIDVKETAGLGDRLRYFGFLLSECGRQFTWVGAALATLGLWLSWRRLPRGLPLALLAGFLGPTVVLLLLLSFDYDALSRSVFRVYPLVAYGLMAVWVALGGQFVLERVRPLPLRAAGWGALLAAALALHLPGNQRAGYTFAHDYARTVLDSLEPNAVLFVSGDMDSFPIAYEHLGEGVRPDVTLYNDQGILFDHRLSQADAPADERQRAIHDFILATPRPVYFTASQPMGFGIEEGGLKLKVQKDASAGGVSFQLSSETRAFFDRAEDGDPRDTWTLLRRDQLRRRLMQLVTLIRMYAPEQYAKDGLGAWSQRYARTAPGMLGALGALVSPGRGLNVPLVLDLADRADAAELQDPLVAKSSRALPAYARAMALRDAGRFDEAVTAFRASLAVSPSNENPALLQLLDCYAETRREREFNATEERYFAGRWQGPGVASQLAALRAKLERR